MTAITPESIRELSALRSDGDPVVSCYLDVDGRRSAMRQGYEAELGRLLRLAREGNGAVAAEADLRRIEDFAKEGLDRSHTRGLAMFSCASQGLWRAVELPVPVYDRIVVGPTPAVMQLEAIVQELERIGVLLVDRHLARVFVFDLGEMIDHSELLGQTSRDLDVRGMKDQGFERERQHGDEMALQHVRNAADVAFDLFREHGFERLTIGAGEDLLPVVESALHPYLRDRLVEPISVPVNAGLDEVRRATIDVLIEVERIKELGIVGRLRDALGSGSLGVAGLDATLEALGERRVETLLISRGYSETGWECQKCGYLGFKGPTCPLDGEEMVRLDDVVEAAVDAAFRQSCRVEVCTDNADLDVLGRIGALLRY